MVDENTHTPIVEILFNEEGTEVLADVTRQHVERRFAMVVENVVHSAPVVNEPIPGGQLQLSMGMLQDYQKQFNKTRELTTLLRAQSAPLELKLKEVHRDEEHQ